MCLVSQSYLTLCGPMDCNLPGSSVHGDSPGKNTGVGCHAFLRESSQPRDRNQGSCIAGRFFTSWTTKEAQEYWSELPILSSRDLPNLGIEQGLLHCRWVLYQLSYQGRPFLSTENVSRILYSRRICIIFFPSFDWYFSLIQLRNLLFF